VLASRTRETVAFFSTPKILRPRYPAGSRAASRSAGAYRGAMARLRDALAVARGACERLISARFAPRGCIGCTYAALSAGKRNFVRQRAACARGIRISPNFLLNEDAPAPQRRLITRARARARACPLRSPAIRCWPSHRKNCKRSSQDQLARFVLGAVISLKVSSLWDNC
jgi:hypothetical protein